MKAARTIAPPAKTKARMGPEAVAAVIEALKEDGVDLVVTLPEEPTYSFTEAVRADPYFTAVSVVGEGHGVAFCAGASLGGRKCVFVTGIAGLLYGTWALSQASIVYGVPLLILAAYRGDLGDRTGIPGDQLRLFEKLALPHLQMLEIPYRIVDDRRKLKKTVRDALFAVHEYDTPFALLLTGDVVA